MSDVILKRPGSPMEWFRLWWLYMTAFPVSERKPFAMILKMWRKGKTDIWYAEAHGTFLGLAITINSPDAVLLDYFAIAPAHRSKGWGHKALAAVLARYHDRGVFLEIEDPSLPGDDQMLRQRRKDFYLSCGLRELGVKALLFGVPMELLGVRCAMTFGDYKDFFRIHYDPWVAEHVTEIE